MAIILDVLSIPLICQKSCFRYTDFLQSCVGYRLRTELFRKIILLKNHHTCKRERNLFIIKLGISRMCLVLSLLSIISYVLLVLTSPEMSVFRRLSASVPKRVLTLSTAWSKCGSCRVYEC